MFNMNKWQRQREEPQTETCKINVKAKKNTTNLDEAGHVSSLHCNG